MAAAVGGLPSAQVAHVIDRVAGPGALVGADHAQRADGGDAALLEDLPAAEDLVVVVHARDEVVDLDGGVGVGGDGFGVLEEGVGGEEDAAGAAAFPGDPDGARAVVGLGEFGAVDVRAGEAGVVGVVHLLEEEPRAGVHDVAVAEAVGEGDGLVGDDLFGLAGGWLVGLCGLPGLPVGLLGLPERADGAAARGGEKRQRGEEQEKSLHFVDRLYKDSEICGK